MGVSGRAEVRAEVGRRTVWLFGRAKLIVPAIQTGTVVQTVDDHLRAWQVPIAFSSDVLTVIEDRVGGDGISVVEVDR
jgi:hypothetical protein